jgi:hypothetical protein
MIRLTEIASKYDDGGGVTKTMDYYEAYTKYFEEIRDQGLNILELGVHEGISLRIFSEYFRNARLLGVDINPCPNDLSMLANVSLRICDQTDRAKLLGVVDAFSPSGLDIVIDDASHYGFYSLTSFEILFPRLKIGGLYIVEDWGTGYWDDWPDGSRYQRCRTEAFDGMLPKRQPSHDAGMVGFVKSLVDLVGAGDIRPYFAAPRQRLAGLEFLHFYSGLAVMKKKSEISL